ncbi:MAG: pyridoxal-phosphate dependent enzyme, partial [Cellulomonadaceae bacterium]|nr:pyridoxal-phosphate dependent enzyme [Cellulomonadaceae bacterium]
MTVTLADVRRAASLLDGVIERTPIQPFRALTHVVGQHVLLKLENLQRTGSFKIRGSYVRMSRLTPAERAAGVIAASAGNHAQGVALAATMLGIQAVVYMPVDAPLPKIEATRSYGAEVTLVGRNVDEALAAARADAEASGKTFIHPFDHEDVIAGQGTIALEILAQVPDVSTVIVPVGGGGLAAGVATVFAEAAPHVKVIGVQAKNASAYVDSLAVGRPLRRTPSSTMADGIAVGLPGDLPFEMLERLGVEVRTVSEGQIARGLLAMAERAKLLVEPAGAVAVAAIMAEHDAALDVPPPPSDPPLRREGVIVPIISGGN